MTAQERTARWRSSHSRLIEAFGSAWVVVELVLRMIAVSLGAVILLSVVSWIITGCGTTSTAQTSSADAPSSATTPSSPTTPSEPPVTSTVVTPTETSIAAAPSSSDATETAAEVAAESAEPSETIGDGFSEAIQPILEYKCASCHSEGGPGAGQLRLDTAGDAAAAASDIADAVGGGYMPPWPASDQSVAFTVDRGLSTAQVKAIVNWGESGGQLDVPKDTPIDVPVKRVALTSSDEQFRIDPYQSQSTVSDDYRCFVIAESTPEPRWVTGFELVPDQTENVHHAIIYRVDGSSRADADALDGADGQPGWTCYGQTELGRSELLLGWAPGQDAYVADPGTAFPVDAESFLVMQMHYHFDETAPVDESTLLVDWGDPAVDYRPIEVSAFVGPVEIPCADGEAGPLCDREAAMNEAVARYGSQGVRNDFINLACRVTPEDFAAATSGVVSSSCELPVYRFGEIVSILGHEHELGSAFRLTLNAGSAEERVLLDIPEWDFDWQYQYHPADSIVVEPGDTMTIECSWDRSLRGPDDEPRYVLWADGTNDEMCFATVATIETSVTP